MKKIIVLGLVAVLIAGLAITSVSASFWGSIKAEKTANGVVVIGNGAQAVVIGGNTGEGVDIGRGTWDIYFPEPTPTPTPVRCRYDKYPYNYDWLRY